MNIFDQMAYRYDTPERAEIATIVAENLKQQMGGFKDKTAIELGCGTGLVGLQLASCFKNITYIDTAKNMVDIVAQKVTALNIKNATALVLDILDETAAPLTADCIFMSQLLLHVPPYQDFLKKTFEMLAPSGTLLIVDFDKNELVPSDRVHNGFDQTQLTTLLKNIGFKNITSTTFYSGKKIFMNQDATMFILKAEK
ncbi:MAG: class I SAM-dependent methyltransferase [Oscillospiraceae bacterium]